MFRLAESILPLNTDNNTAQYSPKRKQFSPNQRNHQKRQYLRIHTMKTKENVYETNLQVFKEENKILDQSNHYARSNVMGYINWYSSF